ncbi:hypothetical protein DIRU0_E16094 [Diutina rugosa]
MLIKPIEPPGARHELDERVNDPIEPTVVINISGTLTAKPLLVIPSTVKILAEIDKAQPIGNIEIVYPTPESKTSKNNDGDEEEEDYDEDAQLYKAMAARASAPTKISILEHATYLSIVISPLANPVEYNLIAQKIADTFTTTKVICVTPCAMDHTVAWLGTPVKGLRQLVPPASITGIGAALASRVKNITILAVNGEGPPAFERVLPDAVVDVSHYLQSLVPIDADYPKKVSTAIRKITDSMYL